VDAYLELAKLFAQNSSSRRAHSARPDAPIQPYVPQRRRIRRIAFWPRPRGVARPRRAPARIECAPSS
jgi:hypothetical protein